MVASLRAGCVLAEGRWSVGSLEAKLPVRGEKAPG